MTLTVKTGWRRSWRRRTYPCDRCRRPHTVAEAGDGTFVAYLESAAVDDEPDVVCADITGLSLDQVRKRQIDVPGLAASLAGALSLKAEFRQRGVGLFLVGTTHERRAPVFLSIKGDDTGYLGDANALKGDTARPLVLLTVTPRAVVAARFGRDGAYTFALADIVTIEGDAAMKVSVSAERLMAQGLPAESLMPIKGPALALKGKRYEIGPDFSWIEDRKAKKRFKTRPLCREAFRVLVECGAGSRDKALRKQEFCDAVYRRAKPDRAPPKDPKPIQFFRVFDARTKRAVQLPFYKDVIQSPGDGRYWLRL